MVPVAYIGHLLYGLEGRGILRLMFWPAVTITFQTGSIGGDVMRPKILFWLAVAMATFGVRSPEGNLFYFFSVLSSMLMIGTSLQRRERRGRKTAVAEASAPKPATDATKAKSI